MNKDNFSVLFFDTEFTGLHQGTSLISIAFADLSGEAEFYAEFNDFNRSECDDWVKEHVLSQTQWIDRQVPPFTSCDGKLTQCYGDKEYVAEQLRQWLSQYSHAQVWADVHCYDWVLFCELFGGALQVPGSVHWIPMDLATAFYMKGCEPDCDREQFATLPETESEEGSRHNALRDARVARACYIKLQSLN